MRYKTRSGSSAPGNSSSLNFSTKYQSTQIKSMKFNVIPRVRRTFRVYHNLFLAMKLTIIFLITALMNANAAGYGQKITLAEKDASLVKVLKQIRQQSGYNFVYNQRSLRDAKKVNINVMNADIDRVLRSCLTGQSLTYEILMNTVVIKPLPEPAEDVEKVYEIQINGKITDDKGEPLAGATVLVKGTSIGTKSDANGNFSVNAEPNSTLIISFVGFESIEVKVGNQTTITVRLRPSVSVSDEVVVVGYGTQKRSSVTAAISKIENDKLDQIPTGRLENAIIGRMAGVNITTQHDRPGQAPEINIRGYNSISAGNSPLIVIDGVPGGDLGLINMNDIESIEVLKDASSAAIYGSRGAGGVVLVTTKRGKSGKPVLSINAYSGFSKAMLYDDWITGKEWYDLLVKYQNRAFATTGGDISIPMIGDPRRPLNYQLDSVIYELPQTIWEKAVTRTAPIQNYNVAISGGNENVRYYVSGTYGNEQGVIKTAGYETFNFRANLNIKVNKRIDMGIDLNPRYVKQRLAGGGNMINFNKYPYFTAPYKVNGKFPRTIDYAYGHSGQASPYTFIYGTRNFVNSLSNIGNAFVNIKLMEGLSFRTSVGTTMEYATNNNYTDGDGDPQVSATGFINESHGIDLVNENVFSFNKTFNEKHDFEALLGASYQLATSQTTRMTAVTNSFNNDIVQTLNNAIINPTASRSSKTQWGLISYFGRINYAYNDKYLLAASLRRDGSSRFGQNNKWGYFPSVSAAWRISKENFLVDNNMINELKLRASYGETGNFNIGDFKYLGIVSNQVFSPDNKTVNGIAQTSIANPDLSWEKVKSFDVGVDLGLLNNRLNFNIDYYVKRTQGMLYQVNVPAITGFTDAIQNIGTVENKGFEIEAQSRVIADGNFKWNASFNFSTIQNKVLDLGGVDERIIPITIGMNWLLRVGEPMFSYYPYKMIGIYQDRDEIDRTPHLAGTVPGNPIVEDRSGDGKIDTDDRYIAGNYMPKATLGFTNQFTWKGFDLSFTLQSSLGSKIYNEEYLFYQGPNLGTLRRSVNNQWWSKEDPGDGKTPGIAISQLYSYITNTDYYIEDASYLNFRNLNVGYDMSGVVKNSFIKSLRLYLSVNNLFIIKNKNFHGYNPEGETSGGFDGINSTPGFNQGSEPMNRRAVIGINLNL